MTASRKAARTPARSNSRNPAAVVPPGEVTAARKASGPSEDPDTMRAAPSSVGFYRRPIAVRFPFSDMRDVALLLERTENTQNGGIGKVVLERRAHFGNGAGAPFPQDSHDVEFASGKRDFHGLLLEV